MGRRGKVSSVTGGGLRKEAEKNSKSGGKEREVNLGGSIQPLQIVTSLPFQEASGSYAAKR